MPSAVEHEAGQSRDGDNEVEVPDRARFSQEEEATLLEQSNAQKAEANRFFGSARYSQAIGEYGKALSSCPNYLEYEIAVLNSNISACHLKLEEWKAAIESANAALDALVRLQPTSTAEDGKSGEADDGVVEIGGEGEDAEQELAKLEMSDQRRQDIRRIKAKALMRRARAKSEEGGWGNLQGAEEDYKELTSMPDLPPQDKKVVKQALSALPARINQAKDKELGDMMGKLKELGNGILKPFGLSTDNFKMTKDEGTGGYNMNFSQDK